MSGPARDRAPNNALLWREYRGVCLWAILLSLVMLAPYLLAWAESRPDARFTGVLSYWQADTSYHLSFVRQAQKGHLLFESKYLAGEAPARPVFNLLFLLIGLLARVFHVPLAAAFNVVRTLSALALLCLTYAYVARAFPLTRWCALLLVSLSSGLGWLTMLGLAHHDQSADLWLIEVSTFWSMRWEVVVPPVVTLLLASLYFSMRFIEEGRLRHAVTAGLSTALLAAVHPHDVLTVAVVTALLLLVRWLRRRRAPHWVPVRGSTSIAGLLWMALPAAPVMAFHLWVALGEPQYAAYARISDPFELAQLLSGYGLVGLLALGGLIVAVRTGRPELDLAAVWAVAGLALAFVPLAPFHQVFVLHGVHLALCVLAAAFWDSVSGGWVDGRGARRVAVRIATVGLVACSALTNVFHYANDLVLASGSTQVPFPHRDLTNALEWSCVETWGGAAGCRVSPLFLPADADAALTWLAHEARDTDVVAVRPGLALYVPYLAGQRVLVPLEDHPEHDRRQRALLWFYEPGRSAQELRGFLATEGVRYVLLDGRQGPGDEGWEARLREIPGISPVLSRGRLRIYRWSP